MTKVRAVKSPVKTSLSGPISTHERLEHRTWFSLGNNDHRNHGNRINQGIVSPDRKAISAHVFTME